MKFISQMKINLQDERVSLRWKFINDKMIFLLVENYHTAENSSISSMSWKFMHLIKIQHLNDDLIMRWKIMNEMKIHHWDDFLSQRWKSSHQIDNRGLHIKLVNFTVLSLALFRLIDTFPGWVGRPKSRIKCISAQLKL